MLTRTIFAVVLFAVLKCCHAQPLPVISVAPPSTASNPDYRTTLYVDLETDTSASLGSYAQGAIVTWWTNIAPLNPNVTLAVYSATTSSSVWPYRTNSITTTGQPAVDFLKNDNTSTQPIISAPGSNQPNTVIMAARFTDLTSASIIDCPGGARTLLRQVSGTSFFAFCGSVQSFNCNVPGNQWIILTFVLNGANSYVRTNGVLVSTGNPGAAGIGVVKFGNDNTLTTPLKIQIAAYREYAEAPSTNNLHIAEQNLATRYLGVTLPPP